MNTRPTSRDQRAFTRRDLLVVLMVIAAIVAICLPSFVRTGDRAMRLSCIANLKRVSIGFRLFAEDTGGYPFDILSRPTNANLGLTPFSTNAPGELWKLFQAAGDNYIAQPGHLLCPSDWSRTQAKSFGTNGGVGEFAHQNSRLNALSYFLSIDADEGKPQNIMAGDRYLTTDPETYWEGNTRFLFGQQDLGSKSPTAKSARWISTLHKGGGIAVFMDGGARQLSTEKLRESLTTQSIGTNRIWLPNTDATGRGNQ